MQDRTQLVAHARRTIARGSKSFAAASMLFDRVTRERVWLLYAWCRAADDLADAQDMGGDLGDQSEAEARLATIRERTALALAGQPTGDASFDGLGVVAAECGLTQAMCDDVIAGFAMDAADWRPRDRDDMLQYCYHVAGAVGVMMAKVMGVPDDDGDTLASDTLDRACDLGIAFQLGNIVRDLWEDDAAGRCYLPVEWLVEADIPPGQHMKPIYREPLVAMVQQACLLARTYEASARIGAARLPFRSRWAILSATGIYGAIARKVEDAGEHGWDHRAFTSRFEKLGHVAGGLRASMAPPPEGCAEQAKGRPLTRLGFAERAREKGYAA
ncbi:phytoene/squalene synthase family protein [Croceicoccus naphthovorans]|uniref:Phytoene synthase n=1 Tax=Croceicoccus naphthovorans TaxID=1348774 RepID=A0A0G3XHM3_9SPHN|nr:phytoene/squalene synthase family protein [Croceicoccus naphthovorans]AKM10116.1 phytoene synthase [Croceicoccus naphthovorans]MBB3991598.1 phytoene synthase [Croceicoccus naphthovorans]